MSKFIHNVSGDTLIVRGIELANGANFLIPDATLPSWKNDVVVNEKIILSQLQMSTDGSTLITDPVDGLSFLKDQIQTVSLDGPKTTTGIQKVSFYEPEGDGATIVTHSFSDKSSWFGGSVQVVNDTLVLDSGNTFKSTNGKTHWIDMTHGRCYDEDNLMLQNANKWALKVYVDGVLKQENLQYVAVEGDAASTLIKDYTVDYTSGKITFNQSQSGVITADYSYATNSYFIIKPKAGKILSIKVAEVQFSANTVLQAPFCFEVWATINHPQAGVITVPVPGTKVVYKNFKDFISACNQGQGIIPKVGGVLTQDVHVFPFDYARPKPIKASQNVEIRVYCMNHLPTLGEFATATFYVTIDNEET